MTVINMSSHSTFTLSGKTGWCFPVQCWRQDLHRRCGRNYLWPLNHKGKVLKSQLESPVWGNQDQMQWPVILCSSTWDTHGSFAQMRCLFFWYGSILIFNLSHIKTDPHDQFTCSQLLCYLCTLGKENCSGKQEGESGLNKLRSCLCWSREAFILILAPSTAVLCFMSNAPWDCSSYSSTADQ